MESLVPCERLVWDSEFFGRRIFRLVPSELTIGVMERVRGQIAAEGIDCLYYLAVSDDGPSVRVAEDAGFRLVDIRVTLARPLTDVSAGAVTGRVEPYREEDVDRLALIAGVSHRDTRFYFDDRFPDEQCDALYERWVRNSCAGFADNVLVARGPTGADGYVTCHLDEEAGRIGLIAVAPEARGAGLGRDLVHGSMEWFKAQGLERVTVVTQGRNVAALRMYEKLGFVVVSVQLWYHLWPEADLSRVSPALS